MFANSAIVSQCAGTDLIGGAHRLGNATSQMDHYFQRVYDGLPSHSMIRYTITFWALGRWRNLGADDYFQLSFNSQIVNNLTVRVADFIGDLCGTSTLFDLRDWRVFGIISHSALTLDFRVISKLTQSGDRLVGFREISFMFDKGPLKSNFHCGRAPVPVLNNECACIEGEYYNGISCEICHSSCSSCYGPSAYDCFQCKVPGDFDGEKCKFSCDSIEIENLQATQTGQ